MSRYSGYLKESVPVAAEYLRRFAQDVQELVDEVNKAIEEDEEGVAELKVEPITQQLTGGIFRLAIEDRRGLKARRVIVDLWTGEKGYPAKVVVPGTTDVLDSLSDKDAIDAYLGDMLRNVDSPIVTFIAFVRRNMSEKKAS